MEKFHDAVSFEHMTNENISIFCVPTCLFEADEAVNLNKKLRYFSPTYP